MTWALGRRRCGAVCALAVIALWGRECRCQSIVQGQYLLQDCCTQCKNGWMYVQGAQLSTVDIQWVCGNSNNLYCDPNRVPAGHYWNPVSCETGLACEVGFYCEQAIKRQCPSGTYSGGTAATSCTACRYNSFNTEEGQPNCAYCRDCYAGQYTYSECTSTTDRVCRTCSSCPAGTYTRANSCLFYLTADTDCISCSAGVTYSTSANSGACTRCSTCAVGKIKTGPCTTTHDVVCRDTLGSCCEQCRDGYFYNSGDFREAYNCPHFCGGGLCKAGSYAEIETCKYCYSCVAGSYCVGDISTICPAGTFSPVNSQSSCLACTAGTNYASGTGSRSCTAYTVCQPGSWVSQAPTTTSDRQCELCSGTWTSATTNSAACDVCRAGDYKRYSRFEYSCVRCQCFEETYIQCPVASDIKRCPPCTGSLAAGYCAAGYEPSVICDGSQTQDTTCRECPEGKEKLSAGVRDCSFCPTGKYKIGANTNACVDCTNKNSHTYPSATVYAPWHSATTPSSNTCPW